MAYFVTGATGFIGKRLVRSLLAMPGSTVYFLLRPSSVAKLASLQQYWGEHGARAHPVFGDVLQEGLGIAAADHAMLNGTIAHVFHLAAIYDLRADAASQLATNIDGTRRVLAAAASWRAGCFHHVSSVAAAGLYEGTFREDMFDEAVHLDHPYFASKHAAERAVREQGALPWRVYRPGLVVGDSRSGETDKADGPYYFFKLIQRIRSLLPPWLPAVGIEGGRINIVPVDFVVAALVHIAHRPGLDGHCFHLTDPATRRVGDVLHVFARAAHAPAMSLRINANVVSTLPDWILKGIGALRPVRRLQQALMRDLGLPPGILELLNWPTRFDNRQAAAALEGSGITCPALEQYAPAIWDYWERHLDPALCIEHSLPSAVAGKVVLVTGGSSGIGLATAVMLAEAGATTLVCGRDAARLQAARQQVATHGHCLHTYQVDLANTAECALFIERVLADHGRVDVLVNNAGRSIRRAIDASYNRLHDFQRLMQINYFGAVQLMLGLLPAMVARGDGHVINISSIGVLTNAPRFAAYAASKAALEAWSYCAAAEFADVGVKFTTINMPLVRTPMIAPTSVYRDAPALTPADAARLVVRAITERPARIATEVGLLGMGVQLAAPHLGQIIMNTAYRLSDGDVEGDASTEERNAPAASPQMQAMQHLLHGVHL